MGEEAYPSIADMVRGVYALPEQDIRTYSPLTLAYIGDSIYDLIIRTMLVERGNSQVNKLHHRASAFVKAAAQREIMQAIEPMLTEEEHGYYKRGRNAKSFTTAKNASILEYRVATGFEALIGFLYLTGRTERMFELVKAGTDYLTQEEKGR
ncbi:MAG: ribonuclease III [Lachnospiraceae bacterium]|nr:ribonuclease III [Lachnospiraceae bacterium]